MVTTIKAFIRLARPTNMALIFAAVVFGAVLALPPGSCPKAGVWGGLGSLLAAGVALSLVAAGGYALNDRLDLSIDRINRPERPLPAGHLSPRAAVVFTVCAWAAAVGLTLLGPGPGYFIVPFCIILSAAYALKLKSTGLLGNLAVALMTSLALAYGSTAAGGLTRVLPMAALAFLVNLSREIYKDVEDLPGDSRAGARTLAVRLGSGPTRLVASSVAFAVTPALVLFYLSGNLFWVDALAIAAGIALPLLFIGIYGLRKPKEAGKVQRWLKSSMFCGLFALLLSRVLYRLIGSGFFG
ncbi:geranylgeranylglycerol-phosphate geranylgeranyltransferase [bacterium]|nr:geranylgeranylglycerol-phosphate geranylgeranyltransferase [bacterium]